MDWSYYRFTRYKLQTAECLWALTNELIANRSLESLDKVEALLSQRFAKSLTSRILYVV